MLKKKIATTVSISTKLGMKYPRVKEAHVFMNKGQFKFNQCHGMVTLWYNHSFILIGSQENNVHEEEDLQAPVVLNPDWCEGGLLLF